jgi:hypothetical protein
MNIISLHPSRTEQIIARMNQSILQKDHDGVNPLDLFLAQAFF